MAADQVERAHIGGTVPRELMGDAGPSVVPGYDPAILGRAQLTPTHPVTVRSSRTFTLTYTVGALGLDDTGAIWVCFRAMSDCGTLQTEDPAAPNFVSAECSGSGRIVLIYDGEGGQRPWNKKLLARLQGGYLNPGDTITIRFGDPRGGSPGMVMPTFAEGGFEFRVFADVVATGHAIPLPDVLSVPVVPGPVTRWRAVLPTLRRPGEKFQLGIKAEDEWGNPTSEARATLRLVPSMPVSGLPETIAFDGSRRAVSIEGLSIDDPGRLTINIFKDDTRIAQAGPLLIAESEKSGYWGDLHGQSGETVGVGTAQDYFRFARDYAFLDVTSHQANDFQVNSRFWEHLNSLTAKLDEPGRFTVFPGYEWSGNTAKGGDHNVFFRHENRPIHRSSHALVTGPEGRQNVAHDLNALYAALSKEDCVLYAHVGGRYANIAFAHDPRLETALEIHSAWGTFEWLLKDAFALGYRCGVVCNSDGHKGRPGASYPGAATFGAYGGLTCFLAEKLDRDAIFEAMRRRHHYGTTGSRIHIGLSLGIETEGTLYLRDPKAHEDAPNQPAQRVMMGDILQTDARHATLDIEVAAPSPILEVTIFNGEREIETVRPFAAADLGNRVRVVWSGAEYRGRGRNTLWQGRAQFTGTSITRFERFNHWNHERKFEQQGTDMIVWRSITTGNQIGFDAWLDKEGGRLEIDTNRGSLDIALDTLGENKIALEAGGLHRCLTVERMPEENPHREVTLSRAVPLDRDGDNPIWIRVRTEDGHQAWTSPVYIIR